MRLWFSHGSDIPIYRQLATQVTLAIVSGELKPGERLPSTRELARRFSVHSNTISAGYKLLEQEGWTERRQGSGVFVRRQADARSAPEHALERHIAGFFRAVRELKLPEATVRARVAEWLAAPRPDHFLVVEPDAQMREILLAEIAEASSFPADGASAEECTAEKLVGAIPLCRPSKTKMVRAALPTGVELVTLKIRSANHWLTSWLPVADEALIGVASSWPEFLDVSRTMLIAAGISSEALVLRDASQTGWCDGLDGTAAVLCDAATARRGLPKGPQAIVFSLIADETLAELAAYPRAGTAAL